MTKKQSIVLFFLVNMPFWVLYFVWPQGLRIAVIYTAFIAMWSLWVARRDRKHLWTSKMRDIWRIQFLWCIATVEANLELFYRHAKPTISVLLIAGILCLTIKNVFNKEKYTIDQL